jgi:hypothetical protein
MSGAIPPLPQYSFMAWCSVTAQGQLYIFTFVVPCLWVSPYETKTCVSQFVLDFTCPNVCKGNIFSYSEGMRHNGAQNTFVLLRRILYHRIERDGIKKSATLFTFNYGPSLSQTSTYLTELLCWKIELHIIKSNIYRYHHFRSGKQDNKLPWM